MAGHVEARKRNQGADIRDARLMSKTETPPTGIEKRKKYRAKLLD